MTRSPALFLKGGALLLLTVALLAAMGWLWAGNDGIVIALVAATVQIAMVPLAGPTTVLRVLGGVPLTDTMAPHLLAMLEDLADRAGLRPVPELWITPPSSIEAVSVGDSSRQAIALSAGAIGTLTPREMQGVLAHELSHLKARDILLFRLIGALAATVRALGMIGLFVAIALLALPGGEMLSPITVAGFIGGPVIATLCEVALLRTREYAADEGAIALTNDPGGLANALMMIEKAQKRRWRHVARGARSVIPGWLSTHPPTADRIRRLLDHR